MSSNKNVKRTVAKANRAILKKIRNAQRECVKGCGRGKAGDRYCTDCGTALPVTGLATKSVPASVPAPAFLAKSEAPTDPLRFGSVDDPDPAVRERAFQDEYSRRLSASIVKSVSAPDESSFWDPNTSDPKLVQSAIHDLTDSRYHSDPAIREATWNALNNRSTKGR